MTAITTTQDLPKDARTGLTLPLSRSLDSRDLAQHRAMVAVELEVLAKKFDRFGWEKDRGSAAHDRMITDWMDALHDYPLDEVRAACKAAVLENPQRMPNEGHIRAHILAARKRKIIGLPKQDDFAPHHWPTDDEKARATKLLQEAGFAPKRFGGGE